MGETITYDPANDIVAGGSHHDTTQSEGAYTPTQDASVGTTVPAAPPDPGILNKAWRFISNGANELWTTAGGAIHAFDTPENRQAGGAGLWRGARDFADKLGEIPNMDDIGPVMPPSAEDLARVRQQNIADRAAYERQYGDNPSAKAGRLGGQIAVTAPVLAPLGAIGGPVADAAGIPALRGLLGVAARGTERAVTGGAMGGTQAALTSDPTQSFWPQVATGAIAGSAFPLVMGAGTDVVSNAIQRLRGGVVPVNPYTGKPFGDDTARADNARTLVGEGVPVQASQVSSDPILHLSDKYGSQIPGSGSPNFVQNQSEQFRNRVLQRASPGTADTNATPDFIARNDAAIDNAYGGSVQAVRSVPAVDANGVNIGTDFNRIRGNIPNGLTPEARAQINGVMGDVEDAFNRGGGQVSGSDAHLLTRRTNSALSPLLDSDNGVLRNYGQQIRAEVDRRLRENMTPQQQVMFDQANSQFRALRTVQDAADSNGSFDPRAIKTAADAARDRYGGPGAVDDIARAGDSVIQPTIDGRSAAGPRVTGRASPYLAGMATTAVVKPLLDWVLAGGAGTTGAGLGLALNKGVQATNRASGPRAINATLSGGGASTLDPRILGALRTLGVANQQQADQPNQ